MFYSTCIYIYILEYSSLCCITYWFSDIVYKCVLSFFFLITAEEDFLTLVEILDFPSDESFIDVNITIIDDDLTETNETFVIYLNSGTGVKLSPYAWTKVIINDDDGKYLLYWVVKGSLLW